jgi:hypothetical protein
MLKNPLIEEWTQDPLYEKAYSLWLEFYWWCELHDEMVCEYRGPNGFAIPYPGTQESLKSSQFDYYLRKILHLEMDAAEIPNEYRRLANHDAQKHHDCDWPKGEPYSKIC